MIKFRITIKNKLVLGSASERRKKILDDLGYSFEVFVPGVKEVSYSDDPQRTAKENAIRKNEWCRTKLPDSIIISADTVIEFQGRNITKPASMIEARSFLRRFSGKTHKVHTAVAISMPAQTAEVKIVTSTVTFKKLKDKVIDEYISKVNPLDKAGGYDIDQHTKLIIESYSGSYTNIMGLPAETLKEWLEELQ